MQVFSERDTNNSIKSSILYETLLFHIIWIIRATDGGVKQKRQGKLLEQKTTHVNWRKNLRTNASTELKWKMPTKISSTANCFSQHQTLFLLFLMFFFSFHLFFPVAIWRCLHFLFLWHCGFFVTTKNKQKIFRWLPA